MILVSYMIPMSVTGLLGQNIFLNTGLINDPAFTDRHHGTGNG